jgi:hypothetical protein
MSKVGKKTTKAVVWGHALTGDFALHIQRVHQVSRQANSHHPPTAVPLATTRTSCSAIAYHRAISIDKR